MRISLRKIESVKYQPQYCNIDISADIYSEKTVEVPIIGLDFPPNKTLRTFPSKVNLTFKVGLSDYSSITSSDFTIGVNYKDLINSDKDQIDLVVTSSNPAVSNIRLNPSKVDYLIEETINFIR